MSTNALYDQLDQQTVRMDQIILLAGMLNDGDAMADPLRELLEDEDDKTLQQCFPDMPANLLACRDDDGDLWLEEFSSWAFHADKWGFLIKFARPVMKWAADERSSTYSWGYYATCWAYGETLEEAIAKGLEWAQQREAAEKAKAQKGGAA